MSELGRSACAQMILDALDGGEDSDIDEIAAYCRIFPETVLYPPESGAH